MMRWASTISLLAALLCLTASPTAYAQAPSFSDNFEAPTLDSSWAVFQQQYGTINLSTDQNHTMGGKQSVKFASTVGGQRSIQLNRSLGTPSKGTTTIYFYDAAPGQQTLYTSFTLINTATNVSATLGTQDFDAFCYKAFVYFANTNAVYGPNANCGSFPFVETTSVQRTLGWHQFTIKVDAQAVSLSIDATPVFSFTGDLSFDTVQLILSGPYWRPDAVAYFDDFSFARAPVAYVTNAGSNSVSVINPTTNTVVATVAVGRNPVHVAVAPNGASAYVTNAGDSTVSVINTATNSVAATVQVGFYPVHAAVTPDGKSVYVTNAGANSVSVISTSSNTVAATILVGANPVHVAIAPDGSRAYVTNAGSNSVSVIDTTNHNVTATVPVGRNPDDVAVF